MAYEPFTHDSIDTRAEMLAGERNLVADRVGSVVMSTFNLAHSVKRMLGNTVITIAEKFDEIDYAITGQSEYKR